MSINVVPLSLKGEALQQNLNPHSTKETGVNNNTNYRCNPFNCELQDPGVVDNSSLAWLHGTQAQPSLISLVPAGLFCYKHLQ